MDEFRIESKFCILIASHLILADAIPIIRITHDLVYLLFIEASSRLIDLSITPRIYVCIRDEWNEWHCFQLPGPSIDIPYLSFTRVRFERIDHYRSANYDVIIIINAVFQRATAIDVRRQMSFYSTSRNYHSRNSSARKLYRRNMCDYSKTIGKLHVRVSIYEEEKKEEKRIGSIATILNVLATMVNNINALFTS